MQKLISIGILLFLLMSCMDNNWNETIDYSFSTSGLYVINSGNLGSSTSSLSYYDVGSKTVYNNVISSANKIEFWGDVAQSMLIHNGIAYLVVNNSGKILLLNIDNGKIIGKVTGLESPRYIHFVNDEKAYVSDLYSRKISIINPSKIPIVEDSVIDVIEANVSDVHIGSISVDNKGLYNQHSTEKMVQWREYVMVACWMRDNKILVVDSYADEVVDSFTVAAQPNSLQIDKYNKLWVLCDGGYDGNPYAYEVPKMYRIDLVSMTIEDSIRFALDDNPQELCLNASKDTLYYLNQHLYRMSVLDTEPSLLIEGNSSHTGYGRGFYGLSIDPSSSEIYISDALDNAQPGNVYRYTSQGMPIDTFNVGVNPIGFCFKE